MKVKKPKITESQAAKLYNAAVELYNQVTSIPGFKPISEQKHGKAVDGLSAALVEIEESNQVRTAVALTPAAKKHRLKHPYSTVCPFCGEDDELGDNLDYQDLDPVEDGSIEQKVSCNNCGRAWMDVFTLSDVRELSSNG